MAHHDDPGLADDLKIAIEPLSRDLVAAYEAFGLDRAREGAAGIAWAFPCEDVPCLPFCVARMNERIIGLSANIAGRIKLGEHEGSAFQAVDSFVAQEARGQRLFTRLASAFAAAAQEAGVDVTWGFPNANAAPAWFGKLGWQNFGQVPFLVRPLNASSLLRRLKLPGSFRLARAGTVPSTAPREFDSETDALWRRFSRDIRCGMVRDAAALNRRIFAAPQGQDYRVRCYGEGEDQALVISRIMHKHGSTIAYILEAMGGRALEPLLRSEMAHLAQKGAELALAWCFPWSPNSAAYRSAGFFHLPDRLRPVAIHFGARALTSLGEVAMQRQNWYLSYLDSDGL